MSTACNEALALQQAAADALSAHGPLAAGDATFVERGEQLAMAQAVARAIEQREALVAEAGTRHPAVEWRQEHIDALVAKMSA